MMLIILHGENIVDSRNKLVELINDAKNKNKSIERLDAKKINPGILESKLVKQDLFGTEITIIIEELHSLPRSKQKKLLVELIAKSEVSVILWEKRKLTATMLKKFPQAKTIEFKRSNSVFNWLDSLSGNKKNKKQQISTLHQALKDEDSYLCLIMLARQTRMLIQVKENGTIAGSPWMVQKIKKQSQLFSLQQLLSIHRQLLNIDLHQKTSTNALNLDQELDLLLLNM
jgi:antitoxin component HigA of HigAB toxin-antitoxin module